MLLNVLKQTTSRENKKKLGSVHHLESRDTRGDVHHALCTRRLADGTVDLNFGELAAVVRQGATGTKDRVSRHASQLKNDTFA